MRATPIYIDSNLGSGIRGENLVPRIRGLGFSDIIIATGYAPESVTKSELIRGVIGKDPPF